MRPDNRVVPCKCGKHWCLESWGLVGFSGEGEEYGWHVVSQHPSELEAFKSFFAFVYGYGSYETYLRLHLRERAQLSSSDDWFPSNG